MRNKEWPDGALKQVSRQAYDAVRRSRGYDYMTPEDRLKLAKSMDRMFGNRHARLFGNRARRQS